MLFPSRTMRNWDKFAWKKGDVLVNKDNNTHIIFDKFKDDTYTTFTGKHYFEENDKGGYNYVSVRYALFTQDFHIDEGDAVQTYISHVEKEFGGKLNRETLEIEKPEFKDGDIVINNFGTIILIKEIGIKGKIYFHAYMINGNVLTKEEISGYYGLIDDIKRVATDSEKQQLFAALAKENKAWDAEKKQIVDLQKKCEFKAFDRVLVRDNSSQKWMPDMYRCYNKDEDFPYICFSSIYRHCIPYNEETKHLLGTTDEWKGGEG